MSLQQQQSKSIRSRQRDAVVNMLNLNATPSISSNNNPSELALKALNNRDPVWKLLIYDSLGQDIISPLLKVNDLRENGITVHMHINSERYPVPDVPAIYFVEPSAENIRIISSDFRKGLYVNYYINFSSALPRALLEELAAAAIAAGTAARVSQVFDQHLNFVSLEPNLFSLQMTDSYLLANNHTTSEAVIESLLSKIVSSLFSVLLSMDAIPVIRCPKGGIAEAVGQKLDSKLRDYLNNNRAMYSALSAVSRPVMILLDRSLDIQSMLVHTWTYSTLVHDILDLKLNRVTVSIQDDRGQKSRRNYDLDSTDAFWVQNAGNPFPKVAEDIDVQINKYKAEVDQVTQSYGVNSLEAIDPNDFSAGAKHLSGAIKLLPELTARKKSLDMHMNIATNLFKQIQERQLDVFFSFEEAVSKQTKANVLEIIRDPKNHPDDKLRLFLTFFLAAVEEPSSADMEEYERELVAANCDVAAVRYAKKMLMYSKMSTMVQAKEQPAVSNDLLGTFTSFGTKLTELTKDSGVAGHFDSLISGVKNLLPSRQELTVTKILDELMEAKSSVMTEDYLTFDPKTPKNTKGKGPKTVYAEAVVFMIGGGNYLEYQNIVEYAQKSTGFKKYVVYGSTEIVNSTGFLKQIQALGANQ